MPGKDFLALMLKAGFHRVALRRYTGFKSSPYTKGALFYAEKPAAGQARDDAAVGPPPRAGLQARRHLKAVIGPPGVGGSHFWFPIGTGAIKSNRLNPEKRISED